MNASTSRSTRSLLTLFTFATIAPLVLLVVLPLQMATSSLGGQATKRVADTSSVAADMLRMQLESIGSLTSTYAQRAEVVNGSQGVDTAGARRSLKELQRANPSIKATMLLDAKGSIVSLEPFTATAVGKDYSFRSYFTGAMASNEAYVSDAFASTAQDNPNYMAISHKVINEAGTTTGVLIAAIEAKAVFQSVVDRFRAEHGADLQVYDQRRHLVAANGLGNALNVVNDTHVNDAIEGTPWSGSMKVAGHDMVRAYSPIGDTGWAVSATVPRSDAFAPVKALESRVVVLAVILGSVVLCAIVLLARSVSARSKTEQRLRSSELRTRTIVDTAQQMFCELDENGLITEWNAQAEACLGWTRDEMIGKKALDVLVPENRHERVRASFEALAAIDSDVKSNREIGTVLRKGTEQPLPVEVSSWMTTTDGHRSINLFMQDISDRVRLQQEHEVFVKRQKALVEELRAADKAKSDFISTISHELRTPLTSITGYLEMLQDGLGGPLNENQQMMIDVVDRNSHRLLTLIEDVLTLSRIESGSFKVERTLADIREIVTGAVETLLPSVHTSGLTLDVDISSNVGDVIGDVNQLERVVMNLLNNAVKFTPEGGRISVVAYRQGQSVSISVSDTGVGIPVEEQPHLFSRFFRASTAQSHAVQGTGLGLTIVKSIVERHGGTVSLQSAANVGTTVYVELPVDVTALESTPA